jgi:hypothetical protein
MRYLYAHGILNTSLKTGNHFKIWKQCPKVRGCLLLHGTLPEPVRHSFSARLSIPSHVLHRFSIIAHPDYPISRLSRRHSVKDRLETSWNILDSGWNVWRVSLGHGCSTWSLHQPPRPSQEASIQTTPRGPWFVRRWQDFSVQGTPIFPNLSQFKKATSGLCDLWWSLICLEHDHEKYQQTALQVDKNGTRTDAFSPNFIFWFGRAVRSRLTAEKPRLVFCLGRMRH